MRVVGLLLISALMIVPVAAAQLVASSFRGTQLLAVGIGLASSAVGTAGSYYTDTPSGGTIVLLAVALFAATAAVTSARAAVRRLHRPRVEERAV
jgi:zinc transport system permease protein